MQGSLAPHRAQLLKSKTYVPATHFLQQVRWQYEESGHVLVDTSSGSNVVAVVVARVLEQYLFCEPNGNYVDFDSTFVNLATAKFQLQLGRPIGTIFAMDYDKVLENIAKIQAQIASTQDRRNFIIVDGPNRNLRFARKIFQKRDRIITEADVIGPDNLTDPHIEGTDNSDSASLVDESDDFAPTQEKGDEDHVSMSPEPTVPNKKEQGELAEFVDYETEHWPVPPRLREELNKIKYEYRAVPLSTYINDIFVEPARVNTFIKGALVELHFELHHFAIRKKAHDSFNASIEQIVILRRSDDRPATAYKRKNPREGPIQVKALMFIQKRISEVPRKSDECPANKENEGPSKRRKTEKYQKPVSEDENGASMSDKLRGKQKATESEDEIEEDVEKNCD